MIILPFVCVLIFGLMLAILAVASLLVNHTVCKSASEKIVNAAVVMDSARAGNAMLSVSTVNGSANGSSESSAILSGMTIRSVVSTKGVSGTGGAILSGKSDSYVPGHSSEHSLMSL